MSTAKIASKTADKTLRASPSATRTGRPAAAGSSGAGAGVPRYLQASGLAPTGLEGVRRQTETKAEEAGPALPVQARLRVGAADDPQERQADRVAQQVVQGAAAEPERMAGTPDASGLEPLRRQAEQDEETLQAKSAGAKMPAVSPAVQRTVTAAQGGMPIPEEVRRRVEPVLGADLSTARVHQDAASHHAAQSIGARAFAHGQHIWLGPGQRADDIGLMAHEATHVVQQSAPGAGRQIDRRIQRQTDTAAVEEKVETAPETVELKGKPTLDEALGEKNRAWIAQQKHHRGQVRVRFGSLASGVVGVKKRHGHYLFPDHPAIRLSHPLFQGMAAEAVAPHLMLSTGKSSRIKGFVGLGLAKGHNELADRLRKAPELVGLAGFHIPRLSVSNELANGQLQIAVKETRFRLGGAFSGRFSLQVIDQSVSLQAAAKIKVKGLEEGELTLERTPQGKVSGTATVAVTLPKNISGSVEVGWDGNTISGRGKVAYTGGKFSGEVTIDVVSGEVAKQREKGAKAAADEKAAAPAVAPASRAAKRNLVVFGEGDLSFAFTDWLTGTAHVIIDPAGHLTVIGEITPQKEYELFTQKDYSKDLFKVEARASYGIPVVGNIFIFANIGMDAFAKLGPAKLYKISISGTYSTDPKKKQDFRIQGSLNISAAAGLRLRGEAGAGLEVLDHDIKAGAGVNALAGIRGYAEATPIIGYREKQASPAEDKKGEFFIRGDLEIAAQPFLGLSGDLFVEIDAPWWSPVPDKRWTWPLGGKEWPLGGSFGINAGVDYVFGSNQWPSLEFKKVDFDADKFITDLYHDKAKPKSAQGEQPGKWKEKNSPAAEPPAKAEQKGDVVKGKPPAKGRAKPRVKPGTARRSGKPVDPNARTAEGKTVKEYQEEARKKEGKPLAKGLDGNAKTDPSRAVQEKTDATKWSRGVRVVRQALAYAEKTGINEKELNRILKSIRKRRDIGFQTLHARKDKTGAWVILGTMSPEQEVTRVKEGESALPTSVITYGGLKHGFGSSMRAKPLTRKGEKGGEPSVVGGHWTQLVKRRRGGSSYYVRGHLLNHHVHGPGNTWKNLSPITRNANRLHESAVENQVKKAVEEGAELAYKVEARYGRPLRNDLLSAVENDTATEPRVKAIRKEIIEAEQYVPLCFVCNVETLRAPPGGKKLSISNREIPNNPEQNSPSDYEVDGGERVSYRLLHVNLNRPVPSGFQGDEESLAKEAYRQLPGVGKIRAARLYERRKELTSPRAVAAVLKETRMPGDALEAWWARRLASFSGETRWDPPRGKRE